MKFRYILIGCLVVISIAFTGVYVFSPTVEERVAQLESPDAWRSKLIEKIQSDSSTPSKPVKVLPAPSPTDLGNQDQKSTPPQLENVLDVDYQVVPPPLEMKKVRMSRSRTTNATEPVLEPWLEPERGIDSLVGSAREMGRSWTFGWIQLAHPMKVAEMGNALTSLGGEVLESAGPLVRARLPGSRDRLEQIAALSWVSGIGALPTEYKITDLFAAEINEANLSESVPVFITLMSGAEHDTWRQDLIKSGVTIGHYDPAIRVFEVVLSYRQIPDLLSNDFVQSIEPIGIATTSHESAVPAMGVDALRSVGNLAGSYSGLVGRSVPIAVLDTGLNTNHVAISSMRQSICGANFVNGEDYDLWVDADGHGTHVTGTIAGNGFNQPAYAGMAPGVQHIRFAKVLDINGRGTYADIHRGMVFLSTESACPGEVWTEDAVKPRIVNMSLSGDSLLWDGRSAGPRKLDSIVWSHRQLYIVANSNSDYHGFSNYASAKNSLAVGAIRDSGDLAGFSSIGPTRDGRLTPQIVGTGVDIVSTQGGDSKDEYATLSGTSMSSPSVAGVAAILMDAAPEHQDHPALVRARLLASAIKPNSWLESSEAFPRTNSNGPGGLQNLYGLGKVSGRTSVLNRDTQDGWISGSAIAEMSDDEYAYVDIEVPENASRIDVVMTWDEPPTDTISRAVLNDLNLWVDVDADCEQDECGEYASESTIDNLERVFVSQPEPGTYRIKIIPHAVYTQPPRVAVAWTILRGDAVPQLSVETDQSIYQNVEAAEHEVNLWITASSYVAAGTRLHIDCRTHEGKSCGGFHSKNHRSFGQWRHEGYTDREDGIAAKIPQDRYISLGELSVGERQRVTLKLSVETSDEPVQIYFTATAWNGIAGRETIIFAPEESADQNSKELITPQNDDFQSATLLTGQHGSLQIDALLGSSEEGEPVLHSTMERPATSIWYSWVATQSGIAGFSVNPESGWSRHYLNANSPDVDVLEGEHVSGLQTVASSTWSAQFFAEQGRKYHVRIGHSNSTFPLRLQWNTGARPANDDFAQAIEIQGETGSMSGTNLGATIEPGEQFGTLASSVWWRWTAPKDGIWSFGVEDASNLILLVFEGNRVNNLRLVSSVPSVGDSSHFQATEGKEYFIVVASLDAYQGGSQFESLTWSETDISLPEGDLLKHTPSLTREEGERWVGLDTNYTVEPGEPTETGIRTRWLSWTTDTTGTYSWNWDQNLIRVSVFSGDTMDDLQLITSGGGGASPGELVFTADKGVRHWISLGLPTHSEIAYSARSIDTTVRWGHTPVNDGVNDAEELLNVAGTTTGTTELATTEVDGRFNLGHNSIWYALKPDESRSGWYKVWVDDSDSELILTVFRRELGSTELRFVIKSRSQRLEGEGREVIFQLESGNEYLVRIGNRQPNQAIRFTLNWEQTTGPRWLRYVGRFGDGWRDATGRLISFGQPRDLEFDSDGSKLFVTATDGLTVFNRDVTTGLLSIESRHSEIAANRGGFLKWDPHRERLLIISNCEWWIYSSSENTNLVRFGNVFNNVPWCYDGSINGARPLFLGKDGNFLYLSNPSETHQFRFTKSASLEYVKEAFALDYENPMQHIVYPTIYGSRWFVRNKDSVSVLMRQNGTGFFERVSEPIAMADFGFAIGGGDQFVYSYDRSGFSVINVGVYEPNDSFTDLVELTNKPFNDLQLGHCVKATARSGSQTIDVICNKGAFTFEYLPQSSELLLRDLLINEGLGPWGKLQSDRYGNLPPSYSIDHHYDPLEESPEGRHLYVSTEAHGILIFERIGNVLVDSIEALEPSHKRLDLIQIEYDRVHFGELTSEDDCLTIENENIDGVVYSVVLSKWQERNVGTDWVDIPDTEQSNQMCSYRTIGNKEYRLIAEIEIDDKSGNYASNFVGGLEYTRLDELVVEPGKVTLDGLDISSCMSISEVILNEKTYTVDHSSWQVRENETSEWEGVPDSEVEGQLCPHDPTDDREYRLIGEFVIDDKKVLHSSNVMKRSSSSS